MIYEKSFSIVIPIFNESKNIINLIEEIKFYIPLNQFKYEIIVVDDCSTDDSIELLNKYCENNLQVKLISNDINMGQSFSIHKGIELSKYSTIVTIDGDGQNNPKNIIKLLDIKFQNNFSLVGGIRKKRKDNKIKILTSKIANNVRKFILKDDCDDTGCSLKVFDKNIFLKFPLFSGLHRFLPALFKGYGCETYFLEVDHRLRVNGISKYGTFDRLFKGIRDIFIVVKIIKKFNKNNDQLYS